MDATLQIELLQRSLKLVEARETEMGEAASAVPVDLYTSREQSRREQDAIFRRFPIVVGFRSQVAKPGDFLTHTFTGVPILVVRGRRGELSAFINACRHRGAPLVSEPCGSGKKTLVCPFHGWCFDTEGRLLAITHSQGFPGLDPHGLSLVRLPVAERHGLVFVVPTPGDPLDLDAYLGPLARDFESFGFDDYVCWNPTVRQRKLNWKLQMDTSHENYHFSYLHSRTAGGSYFNNVGILDYVRPHARIVCPQKTILNLAGTEPHGWRITDYAGILYSLFPSTGYFVHGGYVHVLTTIPIDHESSWLHGAMLVPPGEPSPEEKTRREQHYSSYWSTMEEDISVGEAVQTTVASGANSEFQFGRQEQLLTLFHQVVADAVEGRLTRRYADVSVARPHEEAERSAP